MLYFKPPLSSSSSSPLQFNAHTHTHHQIINSFITYRIALGSPTERGNAEFLPQRVNLRASYCYSKGQMGMQESQEMWIRLKLHS